ncbi:unnamed protein product, partial [Phaedon cochleariae]
HCHNLIFFEYEQNWRQILKTTQTTNWKRNITLRSYFTIVELMLCNNSEITGYVYNMDIDPIDFFPGYDPYRFARQRSRQTCRCNYLTHLMAIVFSVGLCGFTFYYYEHYYGKNLFRTESDDRLPTNMTQELNLQKIIDEMNLLKENMEKTQIWRKHLDELFTKIYFQQESIFDKKVEQALDVYDADRTGLFDYASVYASASIVSTPCTVPYPANKTINFFKFLSIDVMSNPDSVLQPGNLPGNCFAFHGSDGRIRIRLGKRIRIRAVTLDHVKFLDDDRSAPREFEVFGLHDPDDEPGVLLGKFEYKLDGRPYQTYQINDGLTHIPFEYVELHIINNYGNSEFTCVYRFRVHNTSKNTTNNVPH